MTFFTDPALILSEFGQIIGVPGLAFDENGYCCLSFDDVILNFIHHKHAKHIVVSSDLGVLPSVPTQSLLSKYLALNHAVLLMGSGGIGVDEARSRVVYVERIQLRGLDIEALEADITRIVDCVEAVKETLFTADFNSSHASKSASDWVSLLG